MFTLEKTSNEDKFHVICVNYKYLRWSRSRAKVTAPAPAKYPGSGSETLPRQITSDLSLANQFGFATLVKSKSRTYRYRKAKISRKKVLDSEKKCEK